MKCPSCRAPVADDAAICPNCDYIVDPSLFDAEPPQADDEVTGKRQAPAARPAARPGVKKKKKRPAPAPAGSNRMPDAPPPMKREPKGDPGDWRSKISAQDWESGVPKRLQVSEPNIKPLDVDDFLSDTKYFLTTELSLADKLAFYGAIGMAISCCFPWKETVQDGEVLGLLSLGVVVFVLAGVVMVAIATRVRKLLGNLNPLVLWVAQLAAVAGSIAWAVIYVKASWDSTLARAPVGNEEVWVSKPSFGVILAFLCGCVAALGTLFGLKEKQT